MNLEAIFGPKQGQRVRVGLVGVGEFGATFIAQSRRIPGLEVVALCDREPDRALEALRRFDQEADRVTHCSELKSAQRAIEAGNLVVTDDSGLLTGLPLDMVVEATGDPEAAARVAEQAILAGKHVAMVTKEAEIVVGSILRRKAAAAGLVHTPVDGDQPSLLIGLVAWARLLGFEVVCAGKSSESDVVYDPEDGSFTSWGETFATPDYSDLWSTSEDRLTALVGRRVLPGMITSTPPDLCEMGIVANSTGLSVDRPELHAPVARTLELPALFRARSEGGLLERRGIVDMFNCFRRKDELSFAGGVFVTVEVPDVKTGRLLAGKGLPASEDGHTLLLHNPVHLLGLEATLSVLSAVRLGAGTGGVDVRPQLDMVARASRPLPAGTAFSMGARHAIEGIEPLLQRAKALGPDTALPYYMLIGCRLVRDVPEGGVVTRGDIEPPADSTLWRLRAEQDQAFFG